MEREDLHLWKQHKQMLENCGLNFDSIEEFWEKLHAHPEGAFEEFKTVQFIKEWFESLGIATQSIGKTGLIVDIQGKGELQKVDQGLHKVALRADIDALRMKEEAHVTYKSVDDNHAHLLGHDGHTAILIATAELLNNRWERIPKNKSIWLIFQPAESTLEGAKVLISEGCLDGVEEIYGIRNTHIGWEATISLKSGPVLAGATDVDIEVLSNQNDALTGVAHLVVQF